MTYLVRMVIVLVVLSGLIHIFAILTLPFFADQKTWQKVISKAEPRLLTPLNDHSEAMSILGQADPSMVYALCHFDLTKGPVSVTTDGPTDFWNITIYNSASETLYNLHDQVSPTQQLNLEIRNIEQVLREKQAVRELEEVHTSSGNPIPQIRPTDTEEEPEDTATEVGEEDGSLIKITLDLDEGYLVIKIFKSSKHFAKLITERLEAAECK